MSRPRILVVDDDPRTSASVALYLRHGGYDVTIAATGAEALDEAARVPPDLVVLDLMLPEVDGFDVCRTLRTRGDVPIIMLTARSMEEDKLRGLESGADDYVTKPFSPRELVARVHAVLRRARPVPAVVQIGEVEIDRHLRQVWRSGVPVGLTTAEFRLLDVLLSAPGRAFTRAELAERAFGHDYDALDRTIDAHIMNLRRKIEDDRADGLAGPDRASIDALHDETLFLQRLIADLQELALADAGQLELHQETIDVDAIVRSTAAPLANSRDGAPIEIETGADVPFVRGDADRLAQVFRNLLVNARTHTPADGRIAVSVEGDAAHVRVTVRDSGRGIAAEDLPHVFDRFYRADRSRARATGGAGLGLAIARQLVHAHGGTLTASSEGLGRGACFTVVLPAAT